MNEHTNIRSMAQSINMYIQCQSIHWHIMCKLWTVYTLLTLCLKLKVVYELRVCWVKTKNEKRCLPSWRNMQSAPQRLCKEERVCQKDNDDERSEDQLQNASSTYEKINFQQSGWHSDCHSKWEKSWKGHLNSSVVSKARQPPGK